MTTASKTYQELLDELEELKRRLQEAEETLEAIRTGGIDALVIAATPGEERLFTLEGADRAYRVFLESISQGALTLASDGLVLYANEAARRLLSFGPGLVGTHLRTFVRSDERQHFDALFERARSGAIQAEVPMRSRKGALPLYLSLQPLEDRGDQMVIAVLTDLSDRKRAKAALESERLARSIFQLAGEPMIVCDRQGVVIRASRAAVKLAGQQPLFQAFDAVLPLRSADGRRKFALKRHAGLKPVRGQEVRLERADGASFALILNATPLKTTEGLIGHVITLTDVTRLKTAEQARETLLRDVERANRELGTIESLSRAGLQLSNVDQLAHSIVSQVVSAMEADEVALLLVRNGQIELVASVPPIGGGRRPVNVGTGFVGTVVKMGRSVFVENARSSHIVTKRERARGNISLLGAPLIEGADVLGAVCVGWKERHVADAGQQRFLEIIASRAARGIAVRLLAEERDEQRLAAEALALELAETNTQLLSRQEILELLQELTRVATSSLSLPEIGREVLALTHRRLGLGAATLYAMDESAGALRAIALIGFPDDVAADIQVLPLDDESMSGRIVHHGLAMITHESKLLTEWNAGVLRSAIGTEKTRWIVLPLKGGEGTLGTLGLTFIGERPFTDDEFALYHSIAELLSAAFENARLYEEQRRIATTLQKNFIRPLPHVPGMDVGVVSHPAYEPELVGGDFSDVFELVDGRVLVLIADVAGKGVRAAGLTETVRSKIRAFATIDPSPAFVLGKTNELMLRSLPEEVHVTAFLAVLDPVTGHVSYASAGHPPAIHITPHSCRPLHVTFGPPLRSFQTKYVNEHVRLSLDDSLLLYTDGVVEARNDGELFGEDRLIALLQSLRSASAQETAEAVRLGALDFAGSLRDDLHVVCVRLASAASSRRR